MDVQEERRMKDKNIRKILNICENVRRCESITDDVYMKIFKFLRGFSCTIVKNYLNEYIEYLLDAVRVINEITLRSSEEISFKFFPELIKYYINIITKTKMSENHLTEFLIAIQNIKNQPSSETAYIAFTANLSYFNKFFNFLENSVSYKTQVACMEFFVRYFNLLGNREKLEIAETVIPEEFVCSRSLLCEITAEKFDLNCRVFLNAYNTETLQFHKKCNVFSLIAKDIFLEKMHLPKPLVDDTPIDQWIDFNFYSKTITFYCYDKNSKKSKFKWILFEINRENFEKVTVTKIDGICEFFINLRSPITYSNNYVNRNIEKSKTVRFHFKLNSELKFFIKTIWPAFEKGIEKLDKKTELKKFIEDDVSSVLSHTIFYHSMLLPQKESHNDSQITEISKNVKNLEINESSKKPPGRSDTFCIEAIKIVEIPEKTQVNQEIVRPSKLEQFKIPKKINCVTKSPKLKNLSKNVKNAMKENIEPMMNNTAASENYVTPRILTTRKRSLFQINLNDVEVKSQDSRDSQIRLNKMKAARRKINFVEPTVQTGTANSRSDEDSRRERNIILQTIEPVYELIEEHIEPEPIIEIPPELPPPPPPQPIELNEAITVIDNDIDNQSEQIETVQDLEPPPVYLNENDLIASGQYYVDTFNLPPERLPNSSSMKKRYSQSEREKFEANLLLVNAMVERSGKHFFPKENNNKPTIDVYDFHVDPTEVSRPTSKKKKVAVKKQKKPSTTPYEIPHRNFIAPVKYTENKRAIFSYRAAARLQQNIVQPMPPVPKSPLARAKLITQSERLFDELIHDSINEIETVPTIEEPVSQKPRTLGKSELAKRLAFNEEVLYPSSRNIEEPVVKKRATKISRKENEIVSAPLSFVQEPPSSLRQKTYAPPPIDQSDVPIVFELPQRVEEIHQVEVYAPMDQNDVPVINELPGIVQEIYPLSQVETVIFKMQNKPSVIVPRQNPEEEEEQIHKNLSQSYVEKKPFIENWVSQCENFQTDIDVNSSSLRFTKKTFKTIATSPMHNSFKTIGTSPIQIDSENVSIVSESSVKSFSPISVKKQKIKKINFGKRKEERIYSTVNPLQEFGKFGKRKETKNTLPIVKSHLQKLTETFKNTLRDSLTNIIRPFADKITDAKNANFSHILKTYKKYKNGFVTIQNVIRERLAIIEKHEKAASDASKEFLEYVSEAEEYNNKFFAYLHASTASIRQRSNDAVDALNDFSQEVSKEAVVIRKNIWNNHLRTSAQQINEYLLKFAA